MLPIDQMVKFFESVREDWTSPIADEIASRWEEAEGAVKCVRASANYVFYVDNGKGGYILRFNHASERSVAWIQAELAFLTHLRQRGIPVNKTFPSSSGKLVESVLTEQGLFHAVLLETMPGEHRELDEMDAAALSQWGRTLAEFHLASEGYPGEGRPDWRQMLSAARRSVPQDDPPFQKAVDRLEDELSRLPADPSHFGVIHYDFELDNVCWEDGLPGIMDLDDCCRAWYGADIAYALRDLAADRHGVPDQKDERFLAFLAGYRSVRDLEEDEVVRLPLYMGLHHLVSYARLKHTLREEASPEEPQWALDLRAKLQPQLAVLAERLRKLATDEEL